jgi:hypothetical protein
MLRFPTSRLLPGLSKHKSPEISHAPNIAEIADLLPRVLEASDEKSAVEAASQIPDIDASRRIQAYVDIYLTFKDAMSEESTEELRDTIITGMLEFSGKRLPEEVAKKAGVPEEFIEETNYTGVVDYADVQAAIKVWDEVTRAEAVGSIIAGFIEQYGNATTSRDREAALLGEAFYRSLVNGSKISSNERDLCRNLQPVSYPNRFDDDAHQQDVLSIAAERDNKRKMQRELAHAALS